jgi:hypothetical protein
MTISSRSANPSSVTAFRLRSSWLRVNPRQLIFYTVFFLVFCLSGLLTLVAPFPYRMGLVSALVIPLLFLYGLRVDQVSVVYLFLVLEITLSALDNGTPPADWLTFLRIPAFSFLMYYLVKVYVNPQNIVKILKICLFIAAIQLPIILLQWRFYGWLPPAWKQTVLLADFGFGTFNFKTDYAMVFFLTLLVTFLLFDRKRTYFVRHRLLLAFWLSLTVMIANAQILKIPLVLIWAVYLIRYLRIKTIIQIGVALLFLLILVTLLSEYGVLTETATTFVDRLAYEGVQNTPEAYLTGRYSRFGAFRYFFERGILWLGDGPSRYSNPFTRTLLRGNTGHAFTFYTEIGLVGWLLTVLIFFLIAFPLRDGRIKVSWQHLLFFMTINILSFTSQVMNDIAVMLMYCLMAKTYLIPPHHESTFSTPAASQ